MGVKAMYGRALEQGSGGLSHCCESEKSGMVSALYLRSHCFKQRLSGRDECSPERVGFGLISSGHGALLGYLGSKLSVCHPL